MMSSSNKILASIDNHKHNYWGHHLTLSRYPHHRIYLHFSKLFLTFAGNGDSFADPVSLGESWIMMWIKTEKIIFSNYDNFEHLRHSSWRLKIMLFSALRAGQWQLRHHWKSFRLTNINWWELVWIEKKSCCMANSLHLFAGYSCYKQQIVSLLPEVRWVEAPVPSRGGNL